MKTRWIHVDIRWRDRITGELREITDGTQLIEVVDHGGMLVQDEPSGTHRLIPFDNIEGVRPA